MFQPPSNTPPNRLPTASQRGVRSNPYNPTALERAVGSGAQRCSLEEG